MKCDYCRIGEIKGNHKTCSLTCAQLKRLQDKKFKAKKLEQLRIGRVKWRTKILMERIKDLVEFNKIYTSLEVAKLITKAWTKSYNLGYTAGYVRANKRK